MTVEKPWGHEIRWAANEKYIGKILFIKKGHRLSKQYHEQKDEAIYVLDGSLMLELGPTVEEIGITESVKFTLTKGQAQRIRPGVVHRFCALTEDVTLIEVSTPEMEDVVRLEDDYSRK